MTSREHSDPSPVLHSLPRRVAGWLGHELRSMASVAVFFFLAFLLLRLTRAAVLGEFDVRGADPLRALVGALIIAKVLIVADSFRFVARFDARPVAVAAVWKSWIYVAITLGFEYLDALVEFRHSGFREATRRFVHGFGSPVFWMLQVWVSLLLFVFTITRELSRRMGGACLRDWLFGSPPGRRSGGEA